MTKQIKTAQKLPANIIALFDHYEMDANLRVIEYKKTRAGEFLLIGHQEHDDFGNAEFMSFEIYRADRHTGRKCGYIGTPMVELNRQDCSESWLHNQALAIFKAV